MNKYCTVVVPRARLDELTYTFDPAQFPNLGPGDLVLVTLCSKPILGVVLNTCASPCPDRDIQPVQKIMKERVVSKELLSLTRWVADYYVCHLGDVMGLVIPSGVQKKFIPGPEIKEATAVREIAETTPVPVGLARAVAEGRFGVWVSVNEDNCKTVVNRFVEQALNFGSVLILMPEPELSHWLVVLRSCFGEQLVEYHHRLTKKQLRTAWFSFFTPGNKLIVGVRSAVWAPVKNLAGVVLISEHSQAFKEERQPKYNARDVAITRASFARCPVLILDRTPTLETFLNVRRRRFTLVDRLRLPRFQEGVFVVDMRLHKNEIVSPRLLRELKLVKEKGKIALLYINRLGLSRFVVCEDCGQVLKCPHCLVPVSVTGTCRTVCKLCGYTSGAPDICPQCQGAQFLYRSVGVEMVGRSLKELGIEAQIFSAKDNQAQVLVGTKRLLRCEVEKDLGLIALVNFDTEFALPDFRIREKAFALLVELLQRARRFQARMVIQTYRPDDPVLNFALNGDCIGFMNRELLMRQEAGFPPFKRLIAITVKGRDEEKTRSEASALVCDLKKIAKLEVFTPMPLPQKGVRVILKLPRDIIPGKVIDQNLFKRSGVKIKVDVDPLKVV